MLLLTEYLEDHDLYMVIPVFDGKPSPDEEYMFSTEEDQKEFIDYYMKNPFSAVFAYNLRIENSQDETFYNMAGGYDGTTY